MKIAARIFGWSKALFEQTINIPNLGSGVQFLGFTDSGKLISSITVNVQLGGTGDIIGIDDVRIVAAPEPTSLAIFGLMGLAGAGYAGWRRRKAGKAFGAGAK